MHFIRSAAQRHQLNSNVDFPLLHEWNFKQKPVLCPQHVGVHKDQLESFSLESQTPVWTFNVLPAIVPW